MTMGRRSYSAVDLGSDTDEEDVWFREGVLRPRRRASTKKKRLILLGLVFATVLLAVLFWFIIRVSATSTETAGKNEGSTPEFESESHHSTDDALV